MTDFCKFHSQGTFLSNDCIHQGFGGGDKNTKSGAGVAAKNVRPVLTLARHEKSINIWHWLALTLAQVLSLASVLECVSHWNQRQSQAIHWQKFKRQPRRELEN